MPLDLKLLTSLFFNNEVKKSVLDPLTCIIRCSILSYKPIGTKISIIDNKIMFHDPHILQGPIRWTQGDKREDLHNIYNPLLKATQWYKKDNPDILNIFKLAKKGLEKLKRSYDESSIISHSLAFYINILNLFINNNDDNITNYLESNNEVVYGVNTKDENKNNNNNNNNNNSNKNNKNNNTNQEEDNKIYQALRDLWDEKQICIINNILIQVEKEPENSTEWLKALDTILSSKEKQVSNIILKNTTQLG